MVDIKNKKVWVSNYKAENYIYRIYILLQQFEL